MKKNISLLAACGLLAAACAGNPPAWWNPGNAYSSGSSSSRPAPAAERSGTIAVSSPANETLAVPQEEAIPAPLPDDSYEEMILTPLQDEETEDASGESSAQSSPSQTGQLPPPSVLE